MGAKAELLAKAQTASFNAIPAKAGSHIPAVTKDGDGNVTITIPHGKKPTDDHWIQHIFVADCDGDTVKKIIFQREVTFAESDKPSFTVKASDFASASASATKLRAFEYCTK